MTTLQILWFVLIAVLLTGYAVLDGFDLGVGVLHLFARGDGERRKMLNSIGPVWDGNEVWLLTGGGAIFAAFPPVYASVFSGFYLALMLVLLGLIFRAVSLEFRSKVQSPTWRTAWDVGFSVGSILPALLFSVALGNIIRGLHLDASGNYAGTFLALLNPYSLMVGVTGLAAFTTHGALWIVLKTDGALQARARRWAGWAGGAWIVLLLAVTTWTLLSPADLAHNFATHPALFTVPATAGVALGVAAGAHSRRLELPAFLASGAAIALMFATAAVTLFPDLVPATDPELSLTIFNASSSRRTLITMAIMAAIGVPLVLAYTSYAYWTFRGKTRVEPDGY